LAEAIEEETGVKPELIAGAGGIFDVEVDGKMIFSKHKVGRFPEHFEVLNQIKPK
jgi:selT/selW/selH-like putative selenoprotein